MTDSAPPDLDRYLERIAFAGERAPTPAVLARLQLAHLAAIPFENLDVRLGRPVALDLPGLEAKLVRRRRGGYCFEHNTLFAAVLRALGFAVETFEARVRPPGATAILPRTHMVLRVRWPEGDVLVDVGFGGDGPLSPVPLDGTEVEVASDLHRVEREPDGALVLRYRDAEGWRDLYAFLPVTVLPIDFVVANHFTSTHPDSIFLQTLTAQRSEPGVRHALRGRRYTVRRGAAVETRDLADDEVLEVLRGAIGLDVSAAEVRDALAGL